MDIFRNQKSHDADALDAKTADLIRGLYSPPGGRANSGYWENLGARIMARAGQPVADVGKWWLALEGWSKIGLAAAGIALAISGALLQKQWTDETSSAYEYVTTASAPEAVSAPIDLVTQQEPNAQRDALMRLVLSQ